MIRRALAKLAFAAGMLALGSLVGCGGVTTGTAPVAHDQDKTAGHMNHPAGGPNSPLAKASPKPGAPAK